MKAIVQAKYGAPELLRTENVDTPRPRDKDVLVRVHAAAVTRTDCALFWGDPFFMRLFTGLREPRKRIPGTVFAGEVVELGGGVGTFRVGERVWGFHDLGLGALAEYLAAPANRGVVTMPEGLSFEEAAAIPEGGHYAYNFLNKVRLAPGQSALVNGATGAIGSAMVQLLRHFGVTVTGVCATSNAELVRSLGAERTIDYTKDDFTRCGERFDYVFDAVGKSTFGRCKPLLKPDGIYISSELGPYGQNGFLALATPLLCGRKVRFPLPLDINGSLRLLGGLVDRGAFRAVIDRTYSLDEVPLAFERAAGGRKIGNIVVKMNPTDD